MRNQLLIGAAVAALLLAAGCQGRANKVAAVGPAARQAISEAAIARYPGNSVMSPDVQLAAVNYPQKNMIEILNLSDTSVPSSIVWVNGRFLTRIDGIAPKSVVTVQHASLLEAGPATNDLKALNQPVTRVEVQTERGLFSVQGPAIKRD